MLKYLCCDTNYAKRKSTVVEAIKLKVDLCNMCSAESQNLFVC